jgi:hypothetical protein
LRGRRSRLRYGWLQRRGEQSKADDGGDGEAHYGRRIAADSAAADEARMKLA